ncbi:C4-dicarboxylate ABC transporter substrate-binding protein [Marinobacterium nitratireducens]|uniref:C4-dicarboxylate ABC transporter substrate-binding protein n=1 Tax=Marinobacterium nitratireducens TaxID=518897 RepID=A0A917ZFD5_9GAMM|nr:tripartite tricarboxylate transporter substrate-binding protein [Marinobacterium nitratireducens]GGO82011.1 C4-dicarboxylate ABC transporter substrate-binding protein [Marinobacterium nitratireducens]
MKSSSIKTLIASATLALAASQAGAFEQSRTAECIAPANPGGGWDFTCRSVGKVLTDIGLIEGNVQTVNMPGAGGGVAFAHTVSKRGDDSALIVAASTATTTRLAQGQFAGMDQEMVRWVGALGADYGVIAVSKDSPYQTLSDLMSALKEDPNSAKFGGGSAAGGWDHLKVLIAGSAAGIEKSSLPKIKYLAFNGGAEAITQVVGGHIEAFTGDISEAQGFMESGDLRVLAVLSEERLPAPLDGIPTAREQDIDAVAPNWRGFYVPKDVSDDAYQWWVDTMDKVYGSQEWQDVMTKNGLMPFHKSGADFHDFVQQQVKSIKDISTEIGLIK